MTKKQNILNDLKDGIVVNISNDILNRRYGSSCRSRIAELRADGLEIEDKIVHESGAKAYFILKYVEARVEIREHMKDSSYCNLVSFDNVESVYLDAHHNFKYRDLDLVEAARLLREEDYILIPF